LKLQILPLFLLLTFISWPCVCEASAANSVDFAKEIRPILNKHCTGCHGGVKRKGGFSLIYRSEVIVKAKSGAIPIVPGKPSKSELMHRILSADAEERMPPERDPLSRKETELLSRWIEQGANYEEHWAYTTLKETTLPKVKQQTWPIDPIDFFVLNKLEEQHQTPEKEASRQTLIRRVYLDLVGLPPTLDELQAFLEDKTPNAYEKMIDRALTHSGYGEHWTSLWLDMARYADTDGYEKDNARLMYPFRDWCIKALNDDKPFDQFSIEQLAGDLLPNATTDQLVATAFHRNTMINTEGGTDNEEFRVAAIIDRLNTTWTVWLGTSFSCVQCHSHPYDPIMHDEFYKSFDFFNQTQDANRERTPALSIYSDSITLQLKEHRAQLQKLKTDKNNFFKEHANQINQLSSDNTLWLNNDHQQIALATNLTKSLHEQKGKSIRDFSARDQQKFKDELYQWLFPNESKILKDSETFLNQHPENVHVMSELSEDKRRITQLFERGNWMAKGKTVSAATPDFLPKMQADLPKNRLGFSKWLFQKDHPLTARVAVNRFWSQFFGTGFVKTTEDLGTQSEYPSHPELLNHLAYRFMHEMNWSLKKLFKAIVMSATYRQDSLQTDSKLNWDSENRYLSHGPRFRLSAEQIRDQALAVSGLLSAKMYGPSVMPPQPDGIWNSIYNGSKWVTSSGEDRYRRAVYTYWKRTAPYPSIESFDASSREVCSSRRIRTNTPLQALVLLNDPVYLEAALQLSDKALKKEPTLESRLNYMSQLALCRLLSEPEITLLKKHYHEELDYFNAHPEQLKLTLQDKQSESPAELAALLTIANEILNLDEFITKN